MGTFGWDLPPGCRLSDIPGNRPEDEAWEVMIDNFLKGLLEEENKYYKEWAKDCEEDKGEGYEQEKR